MKILDDMQEVCDAAENKVGSRSPYVVSKYVPDDPLRNYYYRVEFKTDENNIAVIASHIFIKEVAHQIAANLNAMPRLIEAVRLLIIDAIETKTALKQFQVITETHATSKQKVTRTVQNQVRKILEGNPDEN